MRAKIANLCATVAFRYAMFYLSITSVITFFLMLLMYGFLFFEKVQPVINELNTHYESIKTALENDGKAGFSRALQEINNSGDGAAAYYYAFIDNHSQQLTANLKEWPVELQSWSYFYTSKVHANNGERLKLWGMLYQTQQYKFYIATSITSILQEFKAYILACSLFLFAIIIVGFLGALVVGNDSLRRVNAVNKTIQAIMRGDLSRRVILRKNNGEFYTLVSNANQMLDRIQELVMGMRQFSNNIAHDLRTPLTRLRNHLEELDGVLVEDNEEIASLLIEEADGILATFNALLRIAQIETAASKENFTQINLATIVLDIVELYEPLAQDKNITLIAENIKPAFVLGDKDMLFQLFANLVDNAIKYSPDDTLVTISCVYRLGLVKVTISDQGMGIDNSEKGKVFDRFYRVEASRGLKPGNGLGLSLVAAVIELHEGQAVLYDNNPGLRVEINMGAVKGDTSSDDINY